MAVWPGVISMPIEEQASYADAVCLENARSKEWNYLMLQAVHSQFPRCLPKNTANIANTAYLVLNAPDEFKEEWTRIYNAYIIALKLKYRL